MKKFISIFLISMLLLCSTGLTVALAATSSGSGDGPSVLAEQGPLYLVPGDSGAISSGARKLTQAECDEIFTANAYLCTLSSGAALPKPTTTKTDKDGHPYTFNGWWSIVDATITYFDTVPDVSEPMFLYADWRADLSQRQDPAKPNGGTTQVAHYMTIKRAATGETETLILRVSGTDMQNAETLGYKGPVQLYNDWFELSKGDVITVYTIGLDSSAKPVAAPILISNKRDVQLEAAGNGSNDTKNYLSATVPQNIYQDATLTCIAETSAHYRIFIKFYSGGSNMAVYMEPMD